MTLSMLDTLTPEHRAIVSNITLKMLMLKYPATFERCEVGPVVTTYYFKPAPTSPPISGLINKAEDLALACSVETVLITRVFNLVAIAVPNQDREIIKFDNSIFWVAQNCKEMTLPLLMGKNTKGDEFSIDLTLQPHILIAGSTGAGKSVFLSQLIASLALIKSPKELELYLVDTKQLDLTLFDKLEHTKKLIDRIEDLHPVLDQLLADVRGRTELLKGHARNIKEYNAKYSTHYQKLAYKVLVIDELADVIGLDVEMSKGEDKNNKRTRISEKLKQLAQISRAAGIHIIAATQRPSVRIINGDIKANFPTRICFKLPTSADSRVVLDEGGAENLLGKGDYLYKTTEDATVKRGHGSFVSMQDITKVLEQHHFIREGFNYL